MGAASQYWTYGGGFELARQDLQILRELLIEDRIQVAPDPVQEHRLCTLGMLERNDDRLVVTAMGQQVLAFWPAQTVAHPAAVFVW